MATITAMPQDQQTDKSFSKDIYEYRGVIFDDRLFPKHRVEAIRTYDDVRIDDVIICTYPKAGTHWAADIAHKIMHDGDLKKAALHDNGDTTYEIVPPFDFKKVTGHKLGAPTLEELSQLPSPRIIGTHLRFDMLPLKVQDGQAKVIYVCRDPRDITVSRWHQMSTFGKLINEPELPWETFFEKCIQGTVTLGTWSKHFRSYQDVRCHSNILFLYYERMKEDLRGSVKAISDFLGKNLSDDKIDAVSNACSFEAAKEARPNSAFLRKGISGGWKTQFTVSQSERFDAHMVKDITDLQLDVPYLPYSPAHLQSSRKTLAIFTQLADGN